LGYGIGINALYANIVDVVSAVDEKTFVTRLLKSALFFDVECTNSVAPSGDVVEWKTFWSIGVGS